MKELLKKLKACPESLKWAKDQSITNAYNDCEHGDWMLWFCAKIGVERKLVVLAACKCARLSLKYVPKGEERPLKAIEVTEAWVEGKATIEEVRKASASASAASSAAAASADVSYYAAAASYYAAAASADVSYYAAAASADVSADVSYYAADASYYAAAASADVSADVSYYAADASYYAADAAADADADARSKTLAKCADIVRSIISLEVIEEAAKQF